MKLAEALILRADLQTRLAQLKARLLQNARVQEGEKPAEDPQKLINEIERAAGELTTLIQRINRTNMAVRLEGGETLTEALAVRDVLRIRHAVLRDLGQAAAIRRDRLTRTEVKFQSTVDVAVILQQADDLAREHRELDAEIQAANWQHDLVE